MSDHGGMEEDVKFADCECCGLREECTLEYIERVRRIFYGRWICGLCAEAVKDEINRSSPRLITTDQALDQHTAFCRSRRSFPEEDLISAMMQLLRRSLNSSPRGVRSTPSSPDKQASSSTLARSESCFPALS